jgi:hypothetical protein
MIGLGFALIILGIFLGVEISIIGTIISIVGFFYGIYSGRKQSTDIKKIREQNEEIIKTLKEREELEDKLKEKEAVIRRFRSSIKSEGISTKKLVEEYREKELNALILYKGFEKPGEKIKSRYIELGFKPVGRGAWLLPPTYLPKNIKTQNDVGNWVESNILKDLPNDYEYCISFVALVDLKKFFAKKKLLPNVKYRVQWRTIWDSLAIDEIYPPEYAEKYIKENISLADIIRISDITFLSSKACSDSELEKIENDRESLISKLKEVIGTSKLTLSDYSKINKDKLVTVLSKYVKNPDQVADSIISEASFWDDFLREKGQFEGELVA